MTVAEYMATCLGHPELGYYMTRDPLGAYGDFITAPEISQVFGELIGAWLGDLWRQLGQPRPVHVVDLGPGRGTLVKDAHRALQSALPELAAEAHWHLVETSPVLKQKQAATLGHLTPTWHSGLDSLPTDGPLLVVANEFFDALPVHQLEMTAQGWRERLVDLADPDGVSEAPDALRFVLGHHGGNAASLVPDALAGVPAGSLVEVPAAALNQVRALAERLQDQGGALLVVDYGPTTSAAGATLQAVAGHGYVDPLESPGEADLTAHVDFAQLASAARAAGTAVHGPVTQGDWLLALGLEARGNALIERAQDREQARRLYDGCRRLVAGDQMGSLFKAMAITAGDLAPVGFTG